MNKHFAVQLIAVLLGLSAVASADTVGIGRTAMLKQNGVQYTGILVRDNELAPCNAKSSADDIVFDPHVDTRIKWPKPCPQFPRFVASDAIRKYLSGQMPATASMSTLSSKSQ